VDIGGRHGGFTPLQKIEKQALHGAQRQIESLGDFRGICLVLPALKKSLCEWAAEQQQAWRHLLVTQTVSYQKTCRQPTRDRFRDERQTRPRPGDKLGVAITTNSVSQLSDKLDVA
jgi:hypothetical protein